MSAGTASGRSAPEARRPRVAYLAYWTTEFDSRLERMVRTSLADGWDVTVYGRRMPGQAPVEERDGYVVRRVPAPPSLRALLGLRPAEGTPGATDGESDPDEDDATPATPAAPAAAGTPVPPARPARPRPRGIRGLVRRVVEGTRLDAPYRALRRQWHGLRRWLRDPRGRLDDRTLGPRRWIHFLTQIAGWSVALDAVAEPADVWHAYSMGALPAALRQRDRLGGRAVYDSRDVFLHARSMVAAAPLRRALHARLERRWARRADRVITVNEGCAELLERSLGVPRPLAILNVPERVAPPATRPRAFHEALGLDAATRVVLYQGGLLTERGIEQGMDAILEVPDAVLVILGYGPLRRPLEALVGAPPYAGRVFLRDAVPPSELLAWTASADATLVAIQPTTLNHRLATPNKLWESMAVGVPVVAADLPGMASIVRGTGCGVLCDPTDPRAIAGAIRHLLDAPPEARERYRVNALEAARTTYCWEVESAKLVTLHRGLLGPARMPA